MVWAGVMWKRSVTFCLSQPIGGRGRRAPIKDLREYFVAECWLRPHSSPLK
jgi:hypothetical protein